VEVVPLAAIAFLVAGSACAAAGVVLLKLGANGRTDLWGFANLHVASGLILCGVGTAFWIYVMATRSLVSIWPFTILDFLLVYLAGIVYFREIPSRMAVVGVGFILIGLYLIARDAA
jgi:hypothetical protein